MVRKKISLLFDFLIPISCSFCGGYDYFASKISICKKCLYKRGKELQIVSESSTCTVCKTELFGKECNFCKSRNIFFRELQYIRIRGDFEKEIIQKIKFGNAPYLSNFFRFGLRKLIKTYRIKKYTSLVITPSNKSTIRKRPISVCKPIIELLTRELRLSVINPLQKKSKELQSGKSFRERFLHAQSAFVIKKEYQNKLSGNFLLVDDVFTTGATINEIAKTLLLNGAKEVDVLVLVKGRI